MYAWPSRGGVIILEDADGADFEFLGIDPLEPPLKRLDDPTAEDRFCRRLLLLGARWFDSEWRYSWIQFLRAEALGDSLDVEYRPDEPLATMREKRWVKVAWPTSGGLWVSEFNTVSADAEEEDDIAIDSFERSAELRLARTMDERSILLQRDYGAKYYETAQSYDGLAFINSWDTKFTGEVGQLLSPAETLAAWNHYHGRGVDGEMLNPKPPGYDSADCV